MVSEIEYREIKQSEPTALFRSNDHVQNHNRIGLTSLVLLSLAANAFGGTMSFREKEDSSDIISKYSYTNLEISNITNRCFDVELVNNLLTEDFFDFVMNPIYTNEFKIKVKSFKIEKFIPSSF